MARTTKITQYWHRHDMSLTRRALNRRFRRFEKEYFRRFGEYLKPSKSRGWVTW